MTTLMEAILTIRPDLGSFEKETQQAMSIVSEAGEEAAEDIEEAFEEAGDSAQGSLDGIDSDGMTGRIQDNLGKISVAFAGLGVASEGFSRKQGETNATLSRVGLISGITESELRDLIGGMVDHTFAAEDAAAGMERLAKSGITTAEEFATILPLMDTFADATGGDVVGSIDLFDRVLSALDVPLSEAGDHMDALGFLANQTTVPLNNLAMLMRREAPALKEYGLSTDDIAVAMAALEAEGIRGPRTVMAFQSALADGEGSVEDFWQALGVSNETLEQQRARLEGAEGSVYAFADANNDVMTPVEKLQANMGNLLFRFGGLADAAGLAAAPIAALGPTMMAVNATQQVMSAGMGLKLVGALKAVTVGFGKLAVAILTNPLFLLAAVIIGLGVLIWKFREQIVGALVGAFDFVKEKVGAVFQWFRDTVDRLGERIGDVFRRVGETIRTVFRSAVDFVKGMINQLIGMFERVINGPATAANALIKTANRLPGVNLPTLPTINIPRLAEGGDIERAGRVMVGEEGPEFLDLPRGARVTPLDKAGDTNITMNVTVQGGSFDEDKLARALDRIARDAAATSTYRRPQ
jgi:hypothetical protein